VRGSTFERLGGFAKVRLIVSDFYERVLATPNLRVYFEGIEMRRLVDHQTKFISAIMGGPASYTDDQIAHAHARLRVLGADFDELVELLRETLEDAGIGEEDVARLCAHVIALREHVVMDAHARAG
jgi:hemoglobin